MRVSGLKLLYGTLQSLCTRRGHISGAVGIDQGITTHEALELLCQLSSDSTIVCTVSHYLYYPKLYLVEGAQWAYAVVGSANLTRDGLYRNIELATLIHLDLASSADIDIYTSFAVFLNELLNPTNPNVQPLNATILKHLAEMALISDEARVPEPRFMIERKEVSASFKALFPPLPVRPAPTAREVVAMSAYSRETPAMAVRDASQPRSSAQPNPSADEPLSDLSLPPTGWPEARLAEPPESSVEAVSAFVERHPLTVASEGHIHQKFYKTSCEVCNNVANALL
jgi:hypothetical protein